MHVQSNLPLVLTNDRFVPNKLNHKLPMYVSPVLDCEAWGTDALNISWEGLDSFVACGIMVVSDVLVLEPGSSVHKPPSEASLW